MSEIIIENERPHIIPIGDLSVEELMKYPIEEIMRYEWFYDIPGYENLYRINNFGIVYSCRKDYYLVPNIDIRKRKRYKLYRSNKLRNIYEHVLVMLTFHGSCPENMEVCHNNGDTSCNRLDNLRYDTHINNMADMQKHGTNSILTLKEKEIILFRYINENLTIFDLGNIYKVSSGTIYDIIKNNVKYRDLRGEKNPSAILNEEKVLEIRRLRRKERFTYTYIASKFNVSPSTIKAICHNIKWTHI